MDYVLPDLLVKALKAPSERTQMESTLIGILVMMLGSLSITTYMIINLDLSFWFKFLIGFGEIGVIVFQWGLLATTYQNYYAFKLANSMYPSDYKLIAKIEEAKIIKEDLDKVIKENELNPLTNINEKKEVKNA